ncbi:MAG TPA: TonB-dependent receptor [Candidatus Elarobacter sp.]|nr:TonB-dependent receptor [Candidatus Elarobacter sp.]
MSTILQIARVAAAFVFAFTLSFGCASGQSERAVVRGIVVDAATGLPVAGATVAAIGGTGRSATGADGRFSLVLAPGVYRLRVERSGYQPAQSDEVVVTPGATVDVTLAVQHATAPPAMRTIGATSTNAATALLRATTTSTTVTTDALRARGVERAGDALRELPGVTNGITGDTAAFGDDIPLQLRGLGTLETTTTIDEHPVAYGFPGGYNFQLSPIAPFRDVAVTYGSGSNVLGTSAIGGVFDLRTLVPTAERRVTVDDGWGTFGRSATTVAATGTAGRIGYALAYGASGIDGPIRHQSAYQPGAAYDVSATSAAVRAIGTYDADSSVAQHAGLAKLRYDFGPNDRITATGVFASYFENKTGNGDADYLDAAPALALAQQKAGTGGCGAGLVPVRNAANGPGGTGPGGAPDGGSPCLPVAQYAAATTGFQGAGPAYQTFGLNDVQFAYEHGSATRTARVALFADRYANLASRQYRLPFLATPGDQFSITDNAESEFGVVAGEDVTGTKNTFGAGFSYLNTAFALAKSTSKASSFASPVVHQQTYELRDVYRPGASLSVLANVALTQASATQSSSIDPRLSVVYTRAPRDVVRISAGATTTQPSGDMLDHAFVPQTIVSAGGGGGIRCGALNSIGNVPSSALHPERGVDDELAYAHGFGGDAYAQLALYDLHVYDKLYSTVVPLGSTGGGFVNSAFLAQQEAAIASACPTQDPASLVGVTGTFNVGALHARGFTLSGRARIDRRTFVDYAWVLDSTAIVSAPLPLLQSNAKLIPGAQLPSLPLHTLDGSLDRLVGRALDVRYTYHWVSDNNTKRLPAYASSDLRVSAPVAAATITLEIDNLFDQYADIRGLLYEGEPYALNRYAPAGAYVPYLGAAESERFGLPARTLYLNASYRVR